MAIQDLNIWAKQVQVDPTAGNAQRRDITDEEFLEGWKRLAGASAQQMNQLMFLLSSYSAPLSTLPHLHYAVGTSIPDTALEMNGQAITSGDVPELFAYYGATLPDLTTDAPTNFTYIVRKH